MQHLSLIDETFDINRSSSYNIALAVADSGISYIILDTDISKLVAYFQHPVKPGLTPDVYLDELESIFKKDPNLSLAYKKSHGMVVNRKSTLIPEVLFDPEKLKTLFEFNHFMDELDELHYYLMPKVKSYNVFAMNNQLSNFLLSKQKGIRFFHHSVPMIEKALDTFTGITGAFINIQQDFFDIVAVQNNKLKLYNTFPLSGDSDLLYYLLYAFKQLFFDPLKTEILLTGSIVKEDSMYQTLTTYLPNLRFDKTASSLTISYTINKQPQHLFTNLVNLLLCE